MPFRLLVSRPCSSNFCLYPSLFSQFDRNLSLPTKIMRTGKDSNLSVETDNVEDDASSVSMYTASVDKWPRLSAEKSPASDDKREATFDLREYLDRRRSSKVTKDSASVDRWSRLSAESSPTSNGKRKAKVDLREYLERKSYEVTKDSSSLPQRSPFEDSVHDLDEHSLPGSFGKKQSSYHHRKFKQYKRYSGDAVAFDLSHSMDQLDPIEPFDICLSKSRGSTRRRIRDERTERDNLFESSNVILRSGMVLLKNYISLSEQVSIVNLCQRLGLGPGGFYQPGYKYGAKLRLQMMCLGRNWDPQTKYEERFRSNGSKAPPIPRELVSLVRNALRDSHNLITEHDETLDPEYELPMISPDICIVNFYNTTGRLGLHQDRDESRDSLRRGLPVISFSIGDSAEFLYGDKRDVDKADEVLLESGDVLIFGGESRHVFHGVKAIIPNSAPTRLLEEAALRPGRLNLTFRQF